MIQTFDYVLVGGGLQSGLIAAALAASRPGMRVAIVERSPQVGGNHTWCFHAADVDDRAALFVEPFVVRRWDEYGVRFPGLTRTLSEPYAAVTSERFARILTGLSQRRRVTLLCGETALRVEAHRVELASGTSLAAAVVIDARGPEAFEPSRAIGFQKFLGLEFETDRQSTPAAPTLIDAAVRQRDGFRFFYTLPLAPDRVLVEDTYFSDSAALDRVALRAEVAAYAARIGLKVRDVVREETGVLPLPARASAARARDSGVLQAGYRGGFFHPTTGYSFPLAVRFAIEAARWPPDQLGDAIMRLARTEARQQRFAALLNRMLFGAFAPEHRFHVLERFYRLPPATIRRFYALTLTPFDRLRILCGRPPRGFSLTRLLEAQHAAIAVRRLPGENA